MLDIFKMCQVQVLHFIVKLLLSAFSLLTADLCLTLSAGGQLGPGHFTASLFLQLTFGLFKKYIICRALWQMVRGFLRRYTTWKGQLLLQPNSVREM